MLYGKEPKSNPSMIKPVLRKRGSEFTKIESSYSTCFFCHPHQIPAEIFLKTTRENTGIKQIWFLECKAYINI